MQTLRNVAKSEAAAKVIVAKVSTFHINITRKWTRSIPRNCWKCQKSQRRWKFQKSDQILNQPKENINKLCLGKISLEKTITINFSVDSTFSNELYGKKRKPRSARNKQKAF